MITFRPVKDEVIVGNVSKCTFEGVYGIIFDTKAQDLFIQNSEHWIN